MAGRWVAVKELELSYHEPETILFAIYPEDGSLTFKFLNSKPESHGSFYELGVR